MALEIGCHTADDKPPVILNSCSSKCPSWDAFSKSREFANFVQSISNQHEWYMLVIRTLGSCAGVCFLRKQMLWFNRKHWTDLWLCLVMLLFQSQCVIEFLRFAPIPLSSSRSVRTKRDNNKNWGHFSAHDCPIRRSHGPLQPIRLEEKSGVRSGRNWGDVSVRWDHCLAISEDT